MYKGNFEDFWGIIRRNKQFILENLGKLLRSSKDNYLKIRSGKFQACKRNV